MDAKNDQEERELDEEGGDDSVLAEEAQSEMIKVLREKLKQAEAKAKEYLDGWQRAQADFVNLRRRDEEAKAELIKFASLFLIEELIPVLDSFNIALSQQAADIRPVYDQMLSVLKSNGLEEFDPLGETFNPREHEALGIVHTDSNKEDHKVLEVLQKGYKLNGRVIRPAKVKTGEFISHQTN